jgi:hypothetical protein
MPSDRVRNILPPDTAATWDVIAPLVPPGAYLGGGTAIAVHLEHRVSRDLDFFFHHGSVDLDELTRSLSAAGPFAVTERVPGTLNGVFSATKVQFLHADEVRPQRLLEPPEEVDGLRVAQLSDLMAMKLKVVGDRGELRDYFDLMVIEQRTGRTVDEGLALFVERFQPEYPQQAINHILLGLGYFDDVDPDDSLPAPRAQIVDYWTRRQPEIVAARGRLSIAGLPHMKRLEAICWEFFRGQVRQGRAARALVGVQESGRNVLTVEQAKIQPAPAHVEAARAKAAAGPGHDTGEDAARPQGVAGPECVPPASARTACTVAVRPASPAACSTAAANRGGSRMPRA